MKKIIFLLFALSLIGGTSFALFPGLFPDTPAFPRIPTGDGTIGKVLTIILGTNNLGNYIGDGTVNNSLTFSGVSASGYLKDDSNCTGTQKYVGIDADGKRICGITNVLLTDYGTIESQDCPADYYRIDDSQGTTSTGQVLKGGDIIKTPPGCTLTVAFADYSILRLDGDTTISFDIGTLADGSTIASAILSNGSVWGRILTETGSYQVGTDIIVVGVRGTSLSVSSTGNTILSIANTGTGWGINRIRTANNTHIELVDSRISSGTTVNCVHKYSNLSVTLNVIKPGQSYSIDPLGCENILPAIISKPKFITYASTPWVRKNTRADIEYMYQIQSISGMVLPASKMTLLEDELNATIPQITGTGGLTLTGMNESTSLCEVGDRWWNLREGCKEISLLAIADFRRPLPMTAGLAPLLFHGNPPIPLTSTLGPGVITPDPGNGVTIPGGGYISYSTGDLLTKLGGTLLGRSIIIETSAAVGPGKVLIDFGGGKYARADFGCMFPGGGTCTLTDLSAPERKKWKISITGGGIPGDFKVGGNGGALGIGTSIKKITIE